MRFVFRLITIVIVLVLFETVSSNLFSQTEGIKGNQYLVPAGRLEQFFLGCLSFRFLRKTGFKT